MFDSQIFAGTGHDRAGKVDQSFFTKVFVHMAAALAVSGLVAFFIAKDHAGLLLSLAQGGTFWIFALLQVGVVLFLSARLNQLSVPVATGLFYFYAILTGVTFSTIFFAFTMGSIAVTFLVTAGTFAATAIYGWTTKNDLSSLRGTLFMLLCGVILAGLVNIFLQSSLLVWLTTFVGIFVFVGLTAFDMQSLKMMGHNFPTANSQEKLAIFGALKLYLDFINLFILLLRLFGRGRE